MIKGYESTEIAHWEEIYDPIRDLEMVEQELLLMVKNIIIPLHL